MNRCSVFTLAVTVALGLVVAIPAGDASAQEKQRVSYKVSAENTKYTQRLFIDVGDAPGHQVRVYEVHRTFPSNPPLINGVKLVESWTRATSDYTDNDGPTRATPCTCSKAATKSFPDLLVLARAPRREKRMRRV
jgi:hypothetical protein